MGSRFSCPPPKHTLAGNKSISHLGKWKIIFKKNALLGGYVSLLEVEPGGRAVWKDRFIFQPKIEHQAINSLLVLREGVFSNHFPPTQKLCKQRVKTLLRISFSDFLLPTPTPPLHAVKNSVERGESSSSYIYPLVKLEVTKGCPCRTSWHRCIWSTSLDCKSYIWQIEKIHILWMDIVCVSPQADQVDWHL